MTKPLILIQTVVLWTFEVSWTVKRLSVVNPTEAFVTGNFVELVGTIFGWRLVGVELVANRNVSGESGGDSSLIIIFKKKE